MLWPKRLYEVIRTPGPWSEEAIDRLYVRLRDALPAYLLAAGADPAPLVEPPRRDLLPVVVKAVAWLAFVGLLLWVVQSGVALILGRMFADWLGSPFLPNP